MATKTLGFAAQNATSPLGQFAFERRSPGPSDVQIQIAYCGVCHSDLHTVRSEWAGTVYPCVPGHEIVGRVTAIGSAVKNFKVGDLAAVGCLVDSCCACESCKSNLEQFCETGFTLTYNSPDKHMPGKPTYGGYSSQIVVTEHFVLRVSDKLDLAATAPLLCAGITTYSPMRHWKVAKGQKVGIVGLGGLGHMGVKWAHAFGAHTVLFTTSPGKTDDARRLGADEVVISKDPDAMKKYAGSFDFILNTVAASHNLDAFVELLKRDCTMCLVGAPAHPHPSPNILNLILKRRQIAGSLIGGIKETQEMLDFCAAHKIVSDIELIPIQKINEAYDRMLKSDVKYRFVIDMSTLGERGRVGAVSAARAAHGATFMITGIHLLAYAQDAEKARAFFKNVLGLPSVDAGEGWLIFALPPAELGVHPAEGKYEPRADGQPPCELYLMCDDVKKTVAELQRKGVEFVSPISEQSWGLLTMLKVPGAGKIGLYQPTHPTAIKMKSVWGGPWSEPGR